VFDLKAAGFADPLLVAANDGVGTKVKIAIESGRHETIASTSSRCASTISLYRVPSPCFSWTITRPANWPGGRRLGRQGHSEGLRNRGCALLGGETAEMPGFTPRRL